MNNKKTKWMLIHIAVLFALASVPVLTLYYFEFTPTFTAVSTLLLVVAAFLTLVSLDVEPQRDKAPEHNTAIERIKSVFDTVRHSSTTIEQSTQSLEELVEQTQISAADISTMMEGVTNMAVKNAQLSEESAHQMGVLENRLEMMESSTSALKASSEEARQESSAGQAVVAELITQSERTSSAIEDLGASIRDIGQEMKNMHKITETIVSISNKTHLLALNAAIESARAGEHGRGFSVVASEIGNLADQSKQSSAMIQDLIAGVTGQMNESLSNIDSVERALENQLNSVTSTLSAFGRIGMSVVEMGSEIDSIYALIEDVDNLKKEMTDIVDQVTLSSQMTSATTQQAALSGKAQLQSFKKASQLCSDLKRMSDTLCTTSETFALNAAS